MYYFNPNDNTTHGSEHDNNHNNTAYHNHSGPLFSQPLDPSSLNGTPTGFSQGLDLNNYDPSNLLLNDSMFDTSQVHNWDFCNTHVGSMDPQEAILLSDPNFLRQHQLLQDQQKEMHTRYNDEVVKQEQQVSNLSAMFDYNNAKQDQDEADNSGVSIKVEEGAEEAPREDEVDNKKQKKSSNRKQHVMTKNEPDTNKIDHQRRFNELQARFRVNYARKPTQQSVKSPTAATASINTTNNTCSNNHNNTTATKTSNIATTNNNTNNDNIKPIPKQPTLPPPQQQQTASSFDEKVTSIPMTPPVATGGLVMTNNEENELSSSFPSRTMPIQIQRVPRHNSSQPFDAESHQKQLDSQLDKVDFNDITVSELKEMLRQRGKPATGKKAVLLQRLQEERDLAKGGRSAGSYGSGGRLLSNRHSQPLPFSRSVAAESPQQRPRSFQGTSPVMIHQSNSLGSNNNGHLMSSPSSPSASSFLPGSPSGSLHRSIANMHIGSPPAMSRRYSPYSPRLSSSPKPSHQEYSSSVPLTAGNNLSSSPVNYNNNLGNTLNNNNTNNNMMLSSSFSARSGRYYNNPKTYKPFTSSALATPDREEDVNPFDSYYTGSNDPPIKEEEVSVEDHPECMMMNNNNMDWMDPNAFDMLLQQQVTQQDMNNSQLSQLTDEQIIALLNSQQQTNAFDFKLNDSNFHQPYYQQQ